MPYTEAQKKATMKYLAEKTDDIRLRVPKGTKDRYREAADRRGESLTAFVCSCVEEQIRVDSDGPDIPPGMIARLAQWLKDHGHDDAETVECIEFVCGSFGSHVSE